MNDGGHLGCLERLDQGMVADDRSRRARAGRGRKDLAVISLVLMMLALVLLLRRHDHARP